jgi:eukaryotic-like serine/threonine-protein kinase
VQGWDIPGYTGVKPLGEGGFGYVMLARHDASGTRVAIKYLHATLLAEDLGFADLFRAEARVLASLDDPNVVRLYEYLESPAGAAIVMELVDGISLREILGHQGQTTAEAALVVLQGSLLGLAAAHARGVVHRDYKPANVLVNGDGMSKLTDFGIAARAGDRPVPAGTLAYAPPEQLSGSPASPAGDVYAATVTFYECLTGHPPFTGDSVERVLYQQLFEPVPLDPVPEPLRPLMAAGLAREPGDRPADATAFVATLRTAAWGAYGQDWGERGRSNLAEAALLLAALWPSGTAPAVQGSAVEQIHLAHGSRASQKGGSQASRESEHLGHLRHVRHVEHLRRLRRLRVATAVVVGVALVAAGVTFALTRGSSHRPGAPASRPSAPASGPGTPVSLASIPLTATSALPAATGDVYVVYQGGKDASAQVSGEVPGAASGEVARLYAQQFPYSAAPAPAGSVTLQQAGSTAMYAFPVTPTLATRYQVKLFKNSTATTPLAISATTIIYVVWSGSKTYAQSCSGLVCHFTATFRIPVTPSALNAEMSKQWYVYFGLNLSPSGPPGLPTSLQLGAGDPVLTAPQRISANEFGRSITFTFQDTNNEYFRDAFQFCTKDTEAEDGIGLPGPHGCGAQSIPYPPGYLG